MHRDSSFAAPFFVNDTATTEIYTLALHDALPTSTPSGAWSTPAGGSTAGCSARSGTGRGTGRRAPRSEEHTAELQSRQYLVCRLLLEKNTPPAKGMCSGTRGRKNDASPPRRAEGS